MYILYYYIYIRINTKNKEEYFWNIFSYFIKNHKLLFFLKYNESYSTL